MLSGCVGWALLCALSRSFFSANYRNLGIMISEFLFSAPITEIWESWFRNFRYFSCESTSAVYNIHLHDKNFFNLSEFPFLANEKLYWNFFETIPAPSWLLIMWNLCLWILMTSLLPTGSPPWSSTMFAGWSGFTPSSQCHRFQLFSDYHIDDYYFYKWLKVSWNTSQLLKFYIKSLQNRNLTSQLE